MAEKQGIDGKYFTKIVFAGEGSFQILGHMIMDM